MDSNYSTVLGSNALLCAYGKGGARATILSFLPKRPKRWSEGGINEQTLYPARFSESLIWSSYIEKSELALSRIGRRATRAIVIRSAFGLALVFFAKIEMRAIFYL